MTQAGATTVLLGTSAKASARRSILSVLRGWGRYTGWRDTYSCWRPHRAGACLRMKLILREAELRGRGKQTNSIT